MLVPVDVPEADMNLDYITSNTRAHAVGDLITVEFYFLLRSGEYIRPHMVQQYLQMVHAARTKQFCVMDIGFWKEGKILSRNSEFHILDQAGVVTLKISNQNNVRMGQTLHQIRSRSK